MSNTQEKSADIIAEMRKDIPRVVDANTILRNYADRLEAAIKREKAAIEADALAAGGIVEAERYKPGNAAAMREALKQVNELNDLWFDTFTLSDGATSIHDEIENIISAALAAPPRNCDVGTPEEQEDRFFAFCKVHECTMNCPIKTKWSFECGHNPSCGVLFGQLPYEEGSAK